MLLVLVLQISDKLYQTEESFGVLFGQDAESFLGLTFWSLILPYNELLSFPGSLFQSDHVHKAIGHEFFLEVLPAFGHE